MKRYKIAHRYPGDLGCNEDPNGEWVLWEDVNKADEPVCFLESMQKLEVKDGDIVVLKHSIALSHDSQIKLRDVFKKIIKTFGCDVHVMLLEEGMEIGVLTKGDGE